MRSTLASRCALPALVLGATVALGCGNVAQEPVSYDIYGAGVGGPFMAGEWEVTLDVAQVALGPVYFCSTEAASAELCPTAVNEFAAVAVIDAVNGTPQPLGQVEGTTGEIRSATYNYGINWFTRQRTPEPDPAAPGGHSAHFEGRATRAGTTLAFVADVDIEPPYAGTQAIQGARMSASIRDARVRLDVALNPRAWWSPVNFDAIAATGNGPFTIAPGSGAYSTLVTRMTTTLGIPRFVWSALAP